MKRFDNLIGGEWNSSDEYSPNINPSNLADVVGEYAMGDAAHMDLAVAAATAAFPAWSKSNIQIRSEALERIGVEIHARREELGALLAREEGKTLAEAIGEAVRASHIFKFLPANAFVFRVRCFPLFGLASALKSRASLWAS